MAAATQLSNADMLSLNSPSPEPPKSQQTMQYTPHIKQKQIDRVACEFNPEKLPGHNPYHARHQQPKAADNAGRDKAALTNKRKQTETTSYGP